MTKSNVWSQPLASSYLHYGRVGGWGPLLGLAIVEELTIIIIIIIIFVIIIVIIISFIKIMIILNLGRS